MSLTPIQEVRLSVGDTSIEFPILSDDSYEYFLQKNNYSVRRASVEAAKSILLLLSMRGEESVDIFSVKGSKAAEQYRLALQMFVKDPSFNPVLTLGSAYAGGISKSDMLANNANQDTNSVNTPLLDIPRIPQTPFEV